MMWQAGIGCRIAARWLHNIGDPQRVPASNAPPLLTPGLASWSGRVNSKRCLPPHLTAHPAVPHAPLSPTLNNNTTPTPPSPPQKFSQLDLTEQTQRAIAEMEFVNMTEVQARTIPQLLVGRDVLGAAKTGGWVCWPKWGAWAGGRG